MGYLTNDFPVLEDNTGFAATAMPTTIGPVKEVSEISSSDACFRLAFSWLQTCVQSHPSCRPKTLPPLPTRVINVGKGGGQDPFLFESNGQLGQYVALSYCWGDPRIHNVLKTTSETFENHKRCIEFASLPKTLQDAVTITRWLGLKYLWIDALCIIQGDGDDWARESGKMCDIYSNAHLTIAGDNSSGNSKGIFNKQAFGTPPKQIPYKDGTVVYVRKELAREHNDFVTLVRMPDNPEPLNCRAWALQEALLSNRILHYTSNELVWECNEWRYCECGHGSAAIGPDDEQSNRSMRKPDVFGTLSRDQIYEKWDGIIYLLTERQLSNDEDKLPALSGLTNQFATMFELVSASGQSDQYLTGLWRSNLTKSLLWTTEDDRYRVSRDKEIVYRRPKSWRAPSWSWASVEGPVTISRLLRFNDCIEIVEASTVPGTPDPYGQVKSGRLVVKGRVVHGLTIEVYEARIGDVYGGFTQGKKYTVRHGDRLRSFISDDSGTDGSSGLDHNNAKVTCLLLGTAEFGGMREDFFLVLWRKVTPSKAIGEVGVGVFERVGASFRESVGIGNNDSGASSGDGRGSLFEAAGEEIITIV
jgi:Heterokaryon incompatibility protein (HET)